MAEGSPDASQFCSVYGVCGTQACWVDKDMIVISPAWDIDSGPHFRDIILLPEAASICVRDLVPVESEWADVFSVMLNV